MQLQGMPPSTMRLLWLGVALTVWALTAGLAAAPQVHAAPDMLVGIEQNGTMEQPDAREDNFTTMGLLGAKAARFVLRFDQVAWCDPRAGGRSAADPNNPCYSWTVADAVVDSANRRGMHMVLSVVGVPPWMHGKGYGEVGETDAQYNAFVRVYADFVAAAGSHYAGRVNHWTIWNEPNSSYFFSPQKAHGKRVSPGRYAAMYAAAAPRLKAAAPGAKVAPGPTGSASTTKPGTFVKMFLAALPDDAPVDAYAHNPYLQDSPDPETRTRNWQAPSASRLKAPWIGLGNLGDLTNILDRDRATRGVPLWLTEFAYETKPDPNGVDEKRAAAWTAEALYTAWTNPRVKMFIWYALFDDGGAPAGFQSGLFAGHNTCGQRWCPKPGAYMFRHPIHVSTEQARVGESVTIWGQGRVEPGKTRIYLWEGSEWQPFANQPDAHGSVWVTWKMRGESWFVACDVVCGPMRHVTVS